MLGGKGTGLLIAVRACPRQRAEGTARAWIVAVRCVQVLGNRLFIGDCRPARCGSVHSTFPAAKCGADRFGDQSVARIEVLVEAVHGKASFLHQVCNSDPGNALFAESPGSDFNDALVSLRLFDPGMAHWTS